MNYADLKFCDMVNGTGLRTVLFVSGCLHHCKGCHNPQTHDPCYGYQFTISTMQTLMDSLNESWCAVSASVSLICLFFSTLDIDWYSATSTTLEVWWQED
jgi:organic radical activating enzyme